VGLLAFAVWPVTVLVAGGVLIQRGRRAETIVTRGDAVFLGSRTFGAIMMALALWITATTLIAVASIFISIPDI
jgi:hypothetical protein